jgi:hypothetical protein
MLVISVLLTPVYYLAKFQEAIPCFLQYYVMYIKTVDCKYKPIAFLKLKNTGFKDAYTNVPLTNLWDGQKENFPDNPSVTVEKIFKFPCTYPCKAAFSRCIHTKLTNK